MPGTELFGRGRGSRLAAVLPLCVFPVSVVLLYNFGLLIGLHSISTTPLPVDDDTDDGSSVAAYTPPSPASNYVPWPSDFSSSANSSREDHVIKSTDEEAGGDVVVDDDEEDLLRRASLMAADQMGEPNSTGCPRKKVAFMFLTKGRMPLRPLWELFFRGHEGCFSVYVHTSPAFTEEPPEGSVFLGRRIRSKPVHWGRASMVDAERRLLANALLDPCNEWFVLLSESCIPLFNFATVYSYLLGSPLIGFVSSFDDPGEAGRGRYRPKMAPVVTLRDWRKGSQWFEARRQLAAVVVSDGAFYPVFREHCRPPCYMDEHYIPTLVTKLLPSMNANRSLTWADWSKSGSHPATLRGRHVSTHFVEGLRRRRGCSYGGGGGSTTICFLFARKFDGSTLGPLLRMATGILGF